uniref:Uncharacterized protein n=1 Tax=Aegilops tauschii subsp. strangulata TaxID=200361 RepID=A0A453F653_AEGTS
MRRCGGCGASPGEVRKSRRAGDTAVGFWRAAPRGGLHRVGEETWQRNRRHSLDLVNGEERGHAHEHRHRRRVEVRGSRWRRWWEGGGAGRWVAMAVVRRRRCREVAGRRTGLLGRRPSLGAAARI